jgi:hypothetical protein
MMVAESVRHRIAGRLAASLPSWADREAVAASAGLRDVQLTGEGVKAWRLLVDEAVAQEKLPALLRAAARRKPDDAALTGMAAAIEAGRLPGAGLPAALLIGGLVLLGAGAWWVWGARAPVAGEERAVGLAVTPAASVEAASTPVAAPAATPSATPASTPSATPASTPSATPASTPVAAPAATPSATPASTPVATPTATPSATPVSAASRPVPTPVATARPSPVVGGAPCAGRSGYAHLGSSTTLTAGMTWTTDRGLTVRAVYPSAENGWNSRGEVQCALPAGTVIELRAAPIAVPGGAYWLPIDGASIRQ